MIERKYKDGRRIPIFESYDEFIEGFKRYADIRPGPVELQRLFSRMPESFSGGSADRDGSYGGSGRDSSSGLDLNDTGQQHADADPNIVDERLEAASGILRKAHESLGSNGIFQRRYDRHDDKDRIASSGSYSEHEKSYGPGDFKTENTGNDARNSSKPHSASRRRVDVRNSGKTDGGDGKRLGSFNDPKQYEHDAGGAECFPGSGAATGRARTIFRHPGGNGNANRNGSEPVTGEENATEYHYLIHWRDLPKSISNKPSGSRDAKHRRFSGTIKDEDRRSLAEYGLIPIIRELAEEGRLDEYRYSGRIWCIEEFDRRIAESFPGVELPSALRGVWIMGDDLSVCQVVDTRVLRHNSNHPWLNIVYLQTPGGNYPLYESVPCTIRKGKAKHQFSSSGKRRFNTRKQKIFILGFLISRDIFKAFDLAYPDQSKKYGNDYKKVLNFIRKKVITFNVMAEIRKNLMENENDEIKKYMDEHGAGMRDIVDYLVKVASGGKNELAKIAAVRELRDWRGKIEEASPSSGKAATISRGMIGFGGKTAELPHAELQREITHDPSKHETVEPINEQVYEQPDDPDHKQPG